MAKEEFQLPNEKVVVKPNFRNPGRIKNPNHRAYFLMDGTYKMFQAPLLKNGAIKNVLTDEEKRKLEKILNMKDNELSVYRKEDNFWHSFVVRVSKEPFHLDLSQPYDYIKYKILMAHTDKVAPSINNIKDKQTYKFYIERQKEVEQAESKKGNVNAKAWAAYSKISQNKENIINFMNAYAESFSNYSRYRNVDKDSTLDFLQGELANIVEKDKELFIEVANDPTLEERILLGKARTKGIIQFKKGKYHMKDDPSPFANNIKEAIQFLKDDKNQDTRLNIETRVDE